MHKGAVVAILSATVLAVIVAGFLYFRSVEPEPPIASVPPLPADAVPFGVWALIGCQNDAGDGACRLVRRVINNEAQRVVLSFVVTRGPTGNAIIVIGLPPSVVIPAGVTITPAGGTAARGAVQRCNAQICTAVVVLNDTLIAELSGAQVTGLEFVNANRRNVNVNVPIGGFREGFAAWLEASPEPTGGPSTDVPVDLEVPAPAPPG